MSAYAGDGSGASSLGEAQRYDAVQRSFHWAVVGLVLVQYLTKWLPRNLAGPGVLNSWHLAIGPAILLLMLLRLGWRLSHRVPPPPNDLAPGLRALSRATHWSFYILLVVLPLLGWAAASGYGARPSLLGLIPLPALIGPDRAEAHQFGGAHATLAWMLLAVIALHVSGALYHLLVKRDGVAQRMLPGGVPQSR